MKRWTLFRWQVRLLAMVDGLLGTHGLVRVTGRWQRQVQAMQTEITSLQRHLQELDTSRGAILRHLCLSYLQLRKLQSPEMWLHFDPRHPAAASAIDVLTRALVTPHWARWRVSPVAEEPNTYTYDLVPDWPALYQDSVQHAANLPVSLIDWLQEQTESR